jgi:hypothetical protein
MNEFGLIEAFRDRHNWRGIYKGIQHLESLIDEICAKHGLHPEMEIPERGYWMLREQRKRTTTVPASDALQGLTFGLTYDIPMKPKISSVTLWARSPITGTLELRSDDPGMLLSTLATLLSVHDREGGKWISISEPLEP